MSTTLVIYCLLIIVASLVGGWIPLVVELTHRRLQAAVSFVAGVMLGMGLLHFLPHALKLAATGGQSHLEIMLWLLGGFLTMFFVERFFCYHHHDVPSVDDNHSHDGCSHHVAGSSHDITWGGAAFGLSIHSILAGMALAASATRGGDLAWPGLSAFLVIVLHKPFDSMTLGTLLAKSKWPRGSRHIVNAAFALAIPFGVALFVYGIEGGGEPSAATLAIALAFSAGMFICIASSDILPELQFHQHDRMLLSVMLLLGLGVSMATTMLEAALR